MFGPYAQDDEYGSRAINPMELYHNQVTRVQGPFSLRMFHRSWGLMLIQANIEAPCTRPGLPRPGALHRGDPRQRLRHRGHQSASFPTSSRSRRCASWSGSTCPRRRSSWAATSPTFRTWAARIDADHIVRGEGVRWFRGFLGEDAGQPHPPSADRLGHRHAQHGRHRARTGRATRRPP